MNNDYTIFLDLDGVLCDFPLAFRQLSQHVTGKAFDINDYDQTKAHTMIEKTGPDYWTNIPPVRDMKELVKYVTDNFLSIKILSSTSNIEGAIEGKKDWLRRHNIPVSGSDIILVKSATLKQKYASPNGILIDDYDKNIKSWVENNGVGILHTSARNSIKQLQQYV